MHANHPPWCAVTGQRDKGDSGDALISRSVAIIAVIVYLGVFANGAMAIDATAYGKASDEQLTDNAGNMYLEEKPDRG